MLELIDKALAYAAEKHRDQTRKNVSQTPYIYHSAMTGFYLLARGEVDEQLVAAAILHDTVEDTEATIEEIEELFGVEVSEMVAHCSEDKSLSWEERKQGQIEAIPGLDRRTALVKLADKLQNISCTVRDIEAGRDPFAKSNRGLEKQRWYFESLVTAFTNRTDMAEEPMFLEFRDKVKQVFADA